MLVMMPAAADQAVAARPPALHRARADEPRVMLDAVRRSTDRHVVVLTSTACAAQAREQAALVHALDGRSIAVVEADHPDIVLGAIAEQLAAAGLEAGALARAAVDAATATVSLRWLRSVASLEAPAPSVTQHLRSWFPGDGFVVIGGSRGRVVPATDPAWSEALARGPVDVIGTLPPTVDARVVERCGEPRRVPVATAPGTQARPTQAVITQARVPNRPAASDGRCPVCEATTLAGACLFCGTTAQPSTDRTADGADRAASTRTTRPSVPSTERSGVA